MPIAAVPAGGWKQIALYGAAAILMEIEAYGVVLIVKGVERGVVVIRVPATRDRPQPLRRARAGIRLTG